MQLLRGLIQVGADPTAMLVPAGTTPLHCAAAANCVVGIKVLLEETRVDVMSR